MRLEIVNQQGRIGDIEMDLILGASPSEVNVQVVQVDGKNVLSHSCTVPSPNH
ncbi:MAG: hypothetical protein ACTTIW_02105 [Porphyromonas sp.]